MQQDRCWKVYLVCKGTRGCFLFGRRDALLFARAEGAERIFWMRWHAYRGAGSWDLPTFSICADGEVDTDTGAFIPSRFAYGEVSANG